MRDEGFVVSLCHPDQLTAVDVEQQDDLAQRIADFVVDPVRRQVHEARGQFGKHPLELANLRVGWSRTGGMLRTGHVVTGNG